MGLTETFYQANQRHDDYSSVDKESSFGGPFENWGKEWTREDVTAPEFKVLFDIEQIPSSLARVDSVELEIFFTLPYAYTPEGLPHQATKNNTCTVGIGPEGATRLVVAGVQGNLWTSDDKGKTWIERDTGIAETLWCVRAFQDGFYACGENGALLHSTDGTAWERQDARTVEHLFTVGADHSRNIKMAHGRNGEMRRKPEKSTWQITGR